MDPGEYDDSMNTDTINRSISADRARDPSAHSTGNSVIQTYLFLKNCGVFSILGVVYNVIITNMKSFIKLNHTNCNYLLSQILTDN